MSDTIKKGYKQTDVGIIPEDWSAEKIENVAPLQRGFDLPNRELRKGDFPVVYSNGILNFHNEFRAKAPGVVTGRSGTIGKVNFIEQDYFPHNTSLWVTDFKGNHPKFIYYLYKAVKLERFGTGSGVPTLNRNDVHLHKVALPPLAEQQATAEVLSDVDALVTSLDALLTKKRNIKQGTMQLLLTGKKSESWEKVSLSKSFTLKARIGWQGLTTAEYLKSGDYHLVTGTDFLNGRVNWETCYFVDKWRFAQDRNIQVKVGDVLVTKDGTISKVAFIDRLPLPSTLNSGVFVLRPKENKYFPQYLFYILNSIYFESFLKQLAASSTISHLYQKDFVNFSFPVPSIEEQKAIAQILSEMDAEIEALEIERDKYKAVKQGMMQELLTGKTRLI